MNTRGLDVDCIMSDSYVTAVLLIGALIDIVQRWKTL